MEQAKKVRALRIVRALVRPDQRADYLRRWWAYVERGRALDARVWLFEDQALPGRFVEFTEYFAEPGMQARLHGAVTEAGLAEACVRRTGEHERYREVASEPRGEGSP